MAKLMTLVKASPALDARGFRAYWADSYLRDLLASPALAKLFQRVVHCHSVPLRIRDDDPDAASEWAGVSEIWFGDRSAAESFLASDELRSINAAHAARLPMMTSMLCHEIPMWDNGLERPTVKLVGFFKPSRTMTREESQRYWNVDHVRVGGELMDPQRFAPRYVQNHAYLDYHADDPRYDFAGAPELWFSSEQAAMRLFHESGNLAALAEDEAKFSDPAATVPLILDEHEMFVREREPQPAH